VMKIMSIILFILVVKNRSAVAPYNLGIIKGLKSLN